MSLFAHRREYQRSIDRIFEDISVHSRTQTKPYFQNATTPRVSAGDEFENNESTQPTIRVIKYIQMLSYLTKANQDMENNMAYMNEERKKELIPGINKVLEKYGVKGKVFVRDYMTLGVKIIKGKINFGTTNFNVNPYRIDKDFEGAAKQLLVELTDAMNRGRWKLRNNMMDIRDTGWLIAIEIGDRRNKYQLV